MVFYQSEPHAKSTRCRLLAGGTKLCSLIISFHNLSGALRKAYKSIWYINIRRIIVFEKAYFRFKRLCITVSNRLMAIIVIQICDSIAFTISP